MLFDQFTVFRIEMPRDAVNRLFPLVPLEWRQHLEKLAAQLRFRPLAKMQQQGAGFEPPCHDWNDQFVLATQDNGLQLLCWRSDERKISGPAIKEAVAEKVKAIEVNENRRVRKLERESLKDDLIQKTLPHIVPTPSRVLIIVDAINQVVMIGTGSESTATDIRRVLQDGVMPVYQFGSGDDVQEVSPRLLVIPMCTGEAPLHYLNWFRSDEPAGRLSLHDAAYLHKDGAKSITVMGHPLDAPVITNALDEGYLPVQVVATVVDEAEAPMADVVLDRSGDFSKIRALGTYKDLPALEHEDDNEAAMMNLQAELILTAAMWHSVSAAVRGAFGADPLPLESSLLAALEKRLMAAVPDADSVTITVGEAEQADEDDQLYPAALQFLRDGGTCSISAIQRALRIGYNRTARLMEMLEKSGIVSPMAANGSRTFIADQVSPA